METHVYDLRAKPINVLIVGIALPNETGVKMYEKLRFKKIGQFEEIGIK